jgi:hypothetical protein
MLLNKKAKRVRVAVEFDKETNAFVVSDSGQPAECMAFRLMVDNYSSSCGRGIQAFELILSKLRTHSRPGLFLCISNCPSEPAIYFRYAKR